MKIMATFDGSLFSESVLPQLVMLAAVPDSEFLLVTCAPMPGGQPMDERVRTPSGAVPVPLPAATMVAPEADVPPAETKEQAVERRLAELGDYLEGLASRLPAGATVRKTVLLDHDPAPSIIKLAMAEQPDIIVMATHGRTGMVHVLFGDTAEKVVSASVAPVLLVHPEGVKHSRAATRTK